MSNPFRVSNPSRLRIGLAMLIALIVDGIQVPLGPAGWFVVDEILDVGAMIAISLLIGFNPLFLPTFIIEAVPVVEMLPTWTACVGAAVLMKRRPPSQPPKARPEASKVIDV